MSTATVSPITHSRLSPQSWEAMARWADEQLKDEPEEEEEGEEEPPHDHRSCSPPPSTSFADSGKIDLGPVSGLIKLQRPLSGLERGRRTALLCPAWAPYVDRKIKPVPQYVLDTIRMVEFTPINLDSRLLSQRNCSLSPEPWNNGQFSKATPLLPSTKLTWFSKPCNEHQPRTISNLIISPSTRTLVQAPSLHHNDHQARVPRRQSTPSQTTRAMTGRVTKQTRQSKREGNKTSEMWELDRTGRPCRLGLATNKQ
ncbi:hypothetical protein F4781DRAFT_436368 [Annulohypoxylon bovei var. microspora]|nr:hypothetical protein F4781DRAFT_436368 [Annulohypoxylon bovei var. microspora]